MFAQLRSCVKDRYKRKSHKPITAQVTSTRVCNSAAGGGGAGRLARQGNELVIMLGTISDK